MRTDTMLTTGGYVALLVRGNGVDLITDYTFDRNGLTNFDATMEAICDHVEKTYA